MTASRYGVRMSATSRVIACGAAVLTALGLTACDTAAPVQSNSRQVTVVGTGQVQGSPDTLIADIAVEVTAPDVAGAVKQSGQRQKAVTDALTARGIDDKDMSTTTVSVSPQYGENSTITGYRASNSTQVTIRELDAAPELLGIVVAAGGDATRINSVSYSIEDDSELVRDARARAFEDARDRAQQYAELSGLSLGPVISISESSQTSAPQPVPAPRNAPMAADVPLEPGEQTVEFSVTAVWELN